jgi:sulfite reductase alpha subunit-like flavoprotein
MTFISALFLSASNLDTSLYSFRNSQVHLYKRKSTNFHLPSNALEKPLVMIGPGTGVAPFLGFLAERRRLLSEVRLASPDFQPAPCWLLFGCRDPQLDFIYEDEVRAFVNEGVLDVAFVAVSKSCMGFVIGSEGTSNVTHEVLQRSTNRQWKYVQVSP